MSWKQIKIFTSDAEQSVLIEPNPEMDGLVVYSIEEDKKSFMLYMSYDEAEEIGLELIRYAQEQRNKTEE